MAETSSVSPGFMVVHGNRPETLRTILAEWMKSSALHPLENEVVLVQSNGVAQWLKLQLAQDSVRGGMGIAAALQTQLPSQFTWSAYRMLLGAFGVPEQSAFDKSRLVWRLMRVLPTLLAQPEFEPLRRFLETKVDAQPDERKLYQLSARVADLFDQYQVYRADWLGAWAGGRDTVRSRDGDQPLEAAFLWQPSLWRALRRDAGAEAAARSRAEVHQRFLAAAQAPDCARPTALPRRITVFGVSSMPQQTLETLAALARWCQVLLYVHNPCQHDWSQIVPDHELLRAQRRRQRPKRLPGEGELAAPSHPLLAAWGRQGRDFIRLLDQHDEREAYAQRFAAIRQQVDSFEPNCSPDEAGSLLCRLQDDILELRSPSETRATGPGIAREDSSLSFHVAHGPQREVEILHDQLLAAFAADPQLTPRHVMVMVPDVGLYTPHVQAVFGQLDSTDARFIPFGIADRGQRQHDPMIAGLEQLLVLPQGRLTASDVLDLLDVPALRRRLDIAEADLPLLHRWLAKANVRWGLHGEQRQGLGLPPELEQNSWAFGLRRMFLGYAVGSGEPWEDVAPMDEVGGLDAALLGPVARLLDLLDHHWRALSLSGTPAQWGVRLNALLDDFFLVADGSQEGLTLLRLQGALQEWQDECAEAGFDQPLALSVVREHWLERIERPSLNQPFFSGGVTFASLMPMRAIPFRWIALLGMNDGDYPRSRIPMDFDLMARDYRPGDRSRREDDRYLFLEALLSARGHLHVSWVGRSIRDNDERPASVLVAQLRDHVAACWRLEGDQRPQVEAGAALLQALTIEHRLQPFHEAYFDGKHPGMASYAREWRIPQTARATTGATVTALVSQTRDEPLELRQLIAFARAPVKFFFNERLRIHFLQDDPVADNQEPFALDKLENWQLQHELIQVQKTAIDAGADRAAALHAGIAAMVARGNLPFARLADAVKGKLAEPMEKLFSDYQRALAQWSQPLPDELLDHAPAGASACLRVQDWLGDLRGNSAGGRCRLVIDSTGLVKKNQYRNDKLIGHWVTHLAGHLAGQPLTSVIVSKAGTVTLSPLDIQTACDHWGELVRLFAEGLNRPLPIAMTTACTWLAKGGGVAGTNGSEALKAARKCYEHHDPQFGSFAECNGDIYLMRAFPTFDALCAGGEFMVLAEQLLRPLVDATKSKAQEQA